MTTRVIQTAIVEFAPGATRAVAALDEAVDASTAGAEWNLEPPEIGLVVAVSADGRSLVATRDSSEGARVVEVYVIDTTVEP